MRHEAFVGAFFKERRAPERVAQRESQVLNGELYVGFACAAQGSGAAKPSPCGCVPRCALSG
jgi:hypothetical protein